MILILVVLLSIVCKLYRRDHFTPSVFIVSSYLLTAIVGIIYVICYKGEVYDYSPFSMIYYIICLFIFLFPFIKFSGNSSLFIFPKRATNLVSYILIGLGFISLFFELKDFNYAELALNWLSARNEYYSDFTNIDVATSMSERISDNIMPLIFLCFPLAMYHLSQKQKIICILLIIVSFTSLISCLKIAERQGIILYIANAIFAYLIFKKEFSESIRKKIFTLTLIIIGLLVGVLGAITFSRFGDDNESLLLSLATYAGMQPLNASYFLEDLHTQALGGRLNFPFITGTPMILILNDEIYSSEYLNVFGSIVGSYYLDFGYFSVFIIAFVTALFYKLMTVFKKRKSLLFFYIYCLYFNIMFVGIFYNKYTSPPHIRNLCLLGIIIWALECVYRDKKRIV